MSTKKLTKTTHKKKKRFNINVETSEELRKVFKAKVVMNGKSVKDVFEELMKEYIKK